MAYVSDVVAPANEEGTKATILKWCKSVGESVVKDEPLIELETDKVTVEISAPATGHLVEIIRQPDQEVAPGDVLGRISASKEDVMPNGAEPATVQPVHDIHATSNQPRAGAGSRSAPRSVGC